MSLIPKQVRQEVNYLAHKLALQHEADVRDSLLEQLMEDLMSGATTADMIHALRRYEQSAKELR